MAWSEPAPGAAPRGVWSVGGLLLAANDVLQARFGACVVRGEVSGYTRASSGHCYFTLKDTDGTGAGIRCAMFRRAASLLDFTPRDGLQVDLRGRVAVYEQRGELQFVVESMQRVGAGTLFEEFLRLKAKLAAQGLFDADRKRPLPPHPRRIGVVTSLGAAALRDVLTTLARRAPQVEVVVYPAPVQGADAPPALVQALATAGARNEVDLLLLCRGGGSLEDLWAFNDERVVRAVAASPLPLVCGVGHETDVSLCDLAADLRAPTPTAAAELAAPACAELMAGLANLQRHARRALQRQVEGHNLRVDRLWMRLSRPAQLLSAHTRRLQSLDERRRGAATGVLRDEALAQQALAARLQRALAQRLQRAAHAQALAASRLQALDPARVLARGYAWVTDESGRPLVSARALHPGQQVQAVWADGRASAEVRQVQLDDPA
jgi:exodeoxyribonuclease VII large subunit